MARRFVWALLALLLTLAAQAQEDLGSVSFPAPTPELTLTAFKTVFAAATDAEDEYPIVLALLRKGSPLWSHVATIDPGWPFLSLEFKVTWAPDAKFCACAYRRNRASVTLLLLDLSEARVREQSVSLEEAVDAVLEAARDTNERFPIKESVEQLEIAKGGEVVLTLSVARAKKHKFTLTIERGSGRITKSAAE